MPATDWDAATFETHRPRLFYPDPWLPEPVAEPNQEPAELASSLTLAFLVVLEQLAPIYVVRNPDKLRGFFERC